VVAVAYDLVSFERTSKLRELGTRSANVPLAFNSSMEVRMEILGQHLPRGPRVKSHEAYYTFVSIDEQTKPRKVAELLPETEEEIRLFDEALQRRELRLILGGKMKIKDATSLKQLINSAASY